MSLMIIILIIVGIFTFLNFQDIRKLKRENAELRLQNRIALESIEFLKRKINPDYKPIETKKPSIPIIEEEKQPVYTKPVWQQKPKKEKKNLESVFGKNILGIIAASLIFIGIIAFGALIFNRITDVIKVFLMIFGSLLMLGLGTFLSLKNKNAFTLSLTGCGAGALFITIFVTHIYFEMIGDILAFGLVLVWALGMFFLSKKIDSKSLVYVTHLGCFISSILAIGYGQVETKMLEITIYQILITGLLLIEDYKNSQILFKISAWTTMIINSALTVCCYNATWYNNYAYLSDGSYGPAPIGTLTFVISSILLIITTISYLLTLKTTAKDTIIETIVSNIIYFGCITFGHMSTLLTYIERLLYPNEDIFFYINNGFHNWIIDIAPSILITILMMICLSVIYLHIKNKETFKYSTISFMYFLALILSIRCFDSYNLCMPLLSIIGLTFLYLHQKTKENIYLYSSIAMIGMDAFMILNLLDGTLIDSVFGLIYTCLLLFAFAVIGYQKKDYFFFPFVYFAIINIPILIFMLEISNEIIALIFITIANIIFALTTQYVMKKPFTTPQKISNILTGIGESIFLFVCSLVVGFGSADMAYLFLSLLLLLLGLCKVKSLINTEHKLLGAWYGIKFTWLTLVPLNSFTGLMEEQFILSITCMFIAFLCILFGFGFNIKSTRIYGLILILASVLKIVVVDMWGQDSMIRVISLIVGGIICFAISAGYNYFEKIKKISSPEEDEQDW